LQWYIWEEETKEKLEKIMVSKLPKSIQQEYI